MSNAIILEWRQADLPENARRKALNEVAKTRIALEVKDLKGRKDTINKIMGEILEDMTKASRDKISRNTAFQSRTWKTNKRRRPWRKPESEAISDSFSRRPGRPTSCRASRTTRYSSTRDKSRRRKSFQD